MRATFALLISLLATSARAKYAMHEYLFEGVVTDTVTGTAVADAHVYVFMEKEPVVWSKGYQTHSPEFATTDSRGSFRATSYLDSYKGSNFFGDDCSRKPKRVDVLVIAPDFLARRLVIESDNLRFEKDVLRVGPIHLARARADLR